jgi:hypothetical protein
VRLAAISGVKTALLMPWCARLRRGYGAPSPPSPRLPPPPGFGGQVRLRLATADEMADRMAGQSKDALTLSHPMGEGGRQAG